MIREILINLGLMYDPGRFALKPSVMHAPTIVAPKASPLAGVKHTKTLHVPNKENAAETDHGTGLVSWEVMTTQQAATGQPSPLTAADLDALEVQRKNTKLKLPVELCQEVKNKLALGLSIKQIEKEFKGVRGASARTIAAISSAINQAKK
jgi:hypothetical protein